MKPILALLPLVALVGCASLSSYQEARVLPKGDGKLGIAVSGYQDDLPRPYFDPKTGYGWSKGQSYYLAEISGRVGLMDNLDAGVRYVIPGAVYLDGKYLLLGADSSSKFQLSAGVKFGYGKLNGHNYSNDELSGVQVIDLIVPVYATVTPTSWLGLTVAPEFCYRISEDVYTYPEGPIVGGNIDLRLGGKTGLVGEFGYHKHLDGDYALMNYGVQFYTPVAFESVLKMIGM